MTWILEIMPVLQHYAVVLMTVMFVGIAVATYWPSRKSKIEQQGRIPFEDNV